MALQRRGHDVLAIVEPRGKAAALLRADNAIDTAFVHVAGRWDFTARWRIRGVLAAFKPDIVQMHLARAAALAGPVARRLGYPSLAKTHNYVKLKNYRAVDHLVPTTGLQHDYLRAAGIAAARITRIPNFSSIESAGTPTPRKFDGPLQVIAIGRFVPKKGLDVLLRALAAVRAAGAEINLTLLGDGPQSDALHDLARELQLDHRVRYLGWQDDVRLHLEAADVFVLPSLDEPFGIVCLEAMAAGTPIVATLTDGPREILNSATAFLVPPNDAAAIATALLACRADPSAANTRAALAHQLFTSTYSEAVVVAQYEGLYERLCRR